MPDMATELKFKKWIETCNRLGIGVTDDMSEMSLDDTFRVLEQMEQRIAELEKIIADWTPLMYVHFPDMFQVRKDLTPKAA